MRQRMLLFALCMVNSTVFAQQMKRATSKQHKTNQATVSIDSAVGVIAQSIEGARKPTETVYTQFDRLLAMYPDSAELYVQRGLYAKSTGENKMAMRDFNRAISLNSQCYQAFVERATINAAIYGLEVAAADFEEAININPEHYYAWYSRGKAKENHTDYEGAMLDFKEAARRGHIEKNHLAFHDMAILAQRLGRLEEAEYCYRKYFKMGGISTATLSNMGYICLEQHRYAEAREWFLKSLHIYNKNLDARLGISLVYFKLDKEDMCSKHLNKLVAQDARLKKGMMGIEALEAEGYFYTKQQRRTMRRMFKAML